MSLSQYRIMSKTLTLTSVSSSLCHLARKRGGGGGSNALWRCVFCNSGRRIKRRKEEEKKLQLTLPIQGTSQLPRLGVAFFLLAFCGGVVLVLRHQNQILPHPRTHFYHCYWPPRLPKCATGGLSSKTSTRSSPSCCCCSSFSHVPISPSSAPSAPPTLLPPPPSSCTSWTH